MPAWIRARPDLTTDDADRIAKLPEIKYAGIWGQLQTRTEYAGERTNVGAIIGADEGYPEIYGGELTDGRWFTRAELIAASPAIVLSADVARKLFGNIQPIDKWVRVGGRPMRVIGIYQAAANIFQPPGQAVHGIIPFRTMDRQFTIDKTNALFIPVKPRNGVTVADAEEAVTIAMREATAASPGRSQHVRHDHAGSDPRHVQQGHWRVLSRHDRAVVGRAARRWHRRHGGDDDQRHRSHARDRNSQSRRRHARRHTRAIPHRGRGAHRRRRQ